MTADTPTYSQGLEDGRQLFILTMAVASGTYRTGLKNYPICKSERAREAEAELEKLKSQISERIGASVSSAIVGVSDERGA